MPIPKRKNNIQIYYGRELLERRQEMLDEITKHDTYLPESILHDDLDLGMLEYIKNNFKVVSDGEQIPIIDRILTIQRWGEMSNNWTFSDNDGNIKLPFISIVRKPDPQPGTNPVLQRTIPDRREFYYATVKTWDGNQMGADVYKIPQPVAVDISYEVNIVCNKIRDLNRFNKIVLQKFSSRQSYTKVKGHYIPIILDRINDNSPIDSMDGRRFYLQTYEFTLLGFLIDDEEFEVKPAISRTLMTYEIMDSPVVRKIIDKGVKITLAPFTADGTRTLFSVGEKIGSLFYVAVNGVIQRINEDFFWINGTSNITFQTPPINGSDIYIAYYPKREKVLINNQGVIVNLAFEDFTYTGSTLSFPTQHIIQDILYVNINGLVEIDIDSGSERYSYMQTGPNTFELRENPLLGSVVGVCYFY